LFRKTTTRDDGGGLSIIETTVVGEAYFIPMSPPKGVSLFVVDDAA
jgi:hypothetical protein